MRQITTGGLHFPGLDTAPPSIIRLGGAVCVRRLEFPSLGFLPLGSSVRSSNIFPIAAVCSRPAALSSPSDGPKIPHAPLRRRFPRRSRKSWRKRGPWPTSLPATLRKTAQPAKPGTGPFLSRLMVSGLFRILGVVPFALSTLLYIAAGTNPLLLRDGKGRRGR